MLPLLPPGIVEGGLYGRFPPGLTVLFPPGVCRPGCLDCPGLATGLDVSIAGSRLLQLETANAKHANRRADFLLSENADIFATRWLNQINR